MAKSVISDAAEDPSLSGLRKAAILFLCLDRDAAARVMRLLDTETIEDITREIAGIEEVNHRVRDGVIEEFYNLALARQYASEGGLDYARKLLDRSLSKEDSGRIMELIEHQVHKQPFTFLQKADPDELLTFIQDEHPQTIALILSHLPSGKGSEILAGLPAAKQIEVVTRIANMEQTNPEVIAEVERGLETRLEGIVSQTLRKVGGVESVAEMLNLADRATEKGILESLESEDPDLVEQIRRLMFVFEDILMVNDKGIQSVLKEVDNTELALSLRTASDDFPLGTPISTSAGFPPIDE